MNRLPLFLSIALLLVMTLLGASCGNVFVRGAINPGAQSVNGTVSIVELSVDGGVSITIITFSSSGMANTLNFCGDQRSQFPANRQVQVSFTPGKPCDNVLAVHLM
jgi:hypothetical protein